MGYLCSDCLWRLPGAAGNEPNIVAAFDYQDRRVKQAVWLLKYRGVRPIAEIFARAIYDRLAEELADRLLFAPVASDKRWLVAPIPLSAKRKRQRGFNQAAEIADSLIRRNQEIFELENGLLVKTRETPTQVSLAGRAERLRNLKGAFAVRWPERVAGRNIILIDDVITTGGTIREASRALRQAGARTVIAAAACRG